METGDIEIMERETTNKGWLAKIENQGILEFGETDELNCDLTSKVGLSDFTFGFYLSDIDGAKAIYAIGGTSGPNRSSIVNDASNYIRITFVDSSSSSTTYRLYNASTEGESLILCSFDRDGMLSCFKYSLDDPATNFGLIDRIDISGSSGVDLGLNVSEVDKYCLQSTITCKSFPILYVNRAMTSEEIHAYVNGIGSPNSLPEDLRGVGSFATSTVGQIFSCRPHRDGIHTDDTGNGYNWTDVGSPVIKPFSAGIR